MMKYIASGGFDVIGFEGPGQGAALIKYGLPFDIEWEKPVKAVLDYFRPDDAALFGLSMGGWLCLRAAAFEPRIKRVIANGHSIDYFKSFPYIIRVIHEKMLNSESLYDWMNKVGLKKAKAENTEGWITSQLMHITKNRDNPVDAAKVWLEMNDVNIHSENVIQDVLLLSAENDHFVPVKMHQKQIAALINARSVTDRIFTKKEHAQNHCQVGNIQLMLDIVLDWLKKKNI